jgi:hypothetical protein
LKLELWGEFYIPPIYFASVFLENDHRNM